MSRFIRIYLFAIALPAVLLAFFGARLLSQGAAWQREQAAEGGALRAERVAQRLADGVREMLDGRLDRIAAAPDPDARLRTLRTMAADDPFVRNVFVWRAGAGIVLPRRAGAPAVERRFHDRLAALLAGSLPWNGPGAREHAVSRGIRPWESGGRPELLAWVRTADGDIAGVEFETFAWLARVAAGASAELVGESGETLVPSAFEPDPDAPAGEAPLEPLFPSWRVRVAPAAGSAVGGARFARLGGVLLGLLLCSLVAGGAVLLRAARRERRDAVRKTEFVSNVSHELRTPLTSIRMYSELLAEDRIGGTERRRRALGTIAAESIRLSRLVNGVLDFSRLEQNRRKYDLEPVDLGEMLAEMQDAERTARDGPAAVALADRDAVRQIVLNLLDNAAKYAPGAPPETETETLPDGRAALRVMDRGPGVPPRAAKRIFDRFYRVDDSTTSETSGNGLGLSIARRLARGMGGDLVYRPRPGGGAVFELTLPASTNGKDHP